MEMTKAGGPGAKKMSLAVHFHPTGHHVASWRHPRAQIDAGSNIDHYLQMAQTAERGKFDLIFFADSLAVRSGDLKTGGRWPQYIAYFEPITLLSAMATVTKRIGLVSTASTSYIEPFNLARLFGSLDHISRGRAGWNVVTTGNPAASRNFGRDEHFAHDERYDRASEFVNIVRGLWDSWDDDAFVMDREKGIYFEPTKMHYLDHEGEFFKVKGPLHMRRPPQGHPVLFQAGTSDVGKALAAKIADCVFVQTQARDKIRQTREDIKALAVGNGRAPDDVRIMAGMSVVVGRTEAEAREQHEFLQKNIHPDVGLAILAAELGGTDLTGVDVDKPLPMDRIPTSENIGSRSGVQNLVDTITNESLTVRQLFERFSGARSSPQLIGSPTQVADQLEDWFKSGVVDGFIIQPAVLPGGLDDFVEFVVPELQRRDLYRTEYEGTTLRDHLGLKRATSRYQNGAAHQR
jgi:FMN-dependent oxidoreductase (nitrilotriacetate monooxygenase family)